MYMSTCIQNKHCHQHSYGFKNLMSSSGSWSKISKLREIRDISDNWFKNSLLKHLTFRPKIEKSSDFENLDPKP